MDLTATGRFCYDNTPMFCVNSAYVLTGSSIKYLCSVLNSSLATWYIRNTALNSGMGVPRWVRFTVERIPIPQIDAEAQRPFIELVDRILKATNANPDADTRDMEKQLGLLVYNLYGLTNAEVTVVTDIIQGITSSRELMEDE